MFGNAERALVDLTHRLAAGENIKRHPRPARHRLHGAARLAAGRRLDRANSTRVDVPGHGSTRIPNPYAMAQEDQESLRHRQRPRPRPSESKPILHHVARRAPGRGRRKSATRPSCACRPSSTVKDDPVMYAHASRVFHLESNPGQCARAGAAAWRTRRLAESAAAAAGDGRDGRRLRHALCARAASELWQGAHPGLGNDPLLGQHHARLLRRLHLLLDHRARRPHHPEPLRAVDPARDRTDPRQDQGLHRHHFRPGRPDREHVPAGLQGQDDRGILPPPVLRVSDHLRQPRHRPQQADLAVPQGARDSRRQENPDQLGPALRPGRALARIREGTGDAPRRRPAEDRARAYRRRHPVEDDEAGHRRLRRVQGDVRHVSRRKPARSSI